MHLRSKMNNEGDAVHMVSSETIAEVMETHFNKNVFKNKVRVVDLKAQDDNYMFVLVYEEKGTKNRLLPSPQVVGPDENGYIPHKDPKTGRFIKAER